MYFYDSTVFTWNNVNGIVHWMKWLLTFIWDFGVGPFLYTRSMENRTQSGGGGCLTIYGIKLYYGITYTYTYKMLKLEACAYVMKFGIMSKVFEWIFMSHLHEAWYDCLPACQLVCLHTHSTLLFIWGFPLFRSICDSILSIQFSMHTNIKSW